jgi:hypothetical protein
MNLSNNSGNSVRPTIAVSPEGIIYVAWGDDNTDGKYDVFLRSSSDTGKTWSPISNITTSLKGQDRLPSIAVDAYGTLYVAWTHKTSDDDEGDVTIEREVYVQYSQDGGQTWSAPYSVSRAPSQSSEMRSQLAIDSAGSLYVIWEEDSGNFDVYVSKGTLP